MVKGSGVALVDTAAVEAVKMLGEFVPGRQSGKPISISFTIPIAYVKPE